MAKLCVIAGASQSGKTSYVMKRVGKSTRLAVWDIEDQFSQMKGFKRVTTRAELKAVLLSKGAFKVAYVAGGDLEKEFQFLCQCVMYAGRYIAPLDFVAEELSDITSAGKARGNWGILLRRGLKREINIYPISQRWSEADKTSVGNASEFVIFRQSSNDDARYLAQKISIPVTEILSLKQYEFIKFDCVTKQMTREFSKK